MTRILPILFTGLLLLLQVENAEAQDHHSNWILRNASETTTVDCWQDTLTQIHFPPGCINMMYPESLFCRIDIMPMDSLHHPHDTSYVGWCQVMMGDDSTHFNYMHCDSTHGSHHQMHFMRELTCQLRWDSSQADPRHHGWRLTGVRGWDGEQWVQISGASIMGNIALFTTSELFSAYALIGEPGGPAGVGNPDVAPVAFTLYQNYPNPFNPSTEIAIEVPKETTLSLAIHDNAGRYIRTLFEGQIQQGLHHVSWNGHDSNGSPVSSGVYFYTVKAGTTSITRKMLLVR